MGQAESRQEQFWEACGFGHVDKVKEFLKESVDVNWVSKTVSRLQYFCELYCGDYIFTSLSYDCQVLGWRQLSLIFVCLVIWVFF